MAWPPPVLATNRTNATPQLDTHVSDHNLANQAINDLVARVGTFANVGSWVVGSTPAGDVAPGTEKQVASIPLGAGTWVVYYSVLLVSPAAFIAGVKVFGTHAGVRGANYTVPIVGASAMFSVYLTELCHGPATVTFNVNNAPNAATVSTYADPANHFLFAVATA